MTKIIVRVFDLYSNSDCKAVEAALTMSSTYDEWTNLHTDLPTFLSNLFEQQGQGQSGSTFSVLNSPRLHIEMSGDLLDPHSLRCEQSVLPRRAIRNDRDYAEFLGRAKVQWERISPAPGKKNQQSPLHPTTSSFLPSLSQLKIFHRHPLPTNLSPGLLIFLTDKLHPPTMYPEAAIDPIARAVAKFQRQPQEHSPMVNNKAPLWLSRLDPAALQQYVKELHEGLAGSVASAFDESIGIPM